jgi:serine acetyltransferase
MGNLKKFSYDIFRDHLRSTGQYPQILFWNKRLFLEILAMKKLCTRHFGRFCFEDRIDMACYCLPPMVFLKWGCMIAHPFGITLSADEIGADCQFAQNITIGTNSRDIPVGGDTSGHQPRIGNLVHVYPGAIISGNITIGDNTIIAGNAFVDKDVPANSVVYGVNKISSLKPHHINSLANQMWHAQNVAHLIPGLVYRSQELFIDPEWVRKRDADVKDLIHGAGPTRQLPGDR